MAEAAVPTGPEDWRAGGFGVYVHWPFCAAKCPYCDFNSHVRAGVDQARWRRALVAEIAAAAAETPGRQAASVFFGGGTPSLMEPETVGAVLEAVSAGWGLAPGAEVTLEANPTSVEAGRFRGYAEAGVNRLSLGVQALRDADLRALGRLHDVAAARAAFDVARAIFARVSFDLIYARQGQGVADWRRELGEAVAMAADHLSLYQLTIEPETRFGELARRGRLRGLPDAELSAEMYHATQEICDVAGLPAYEVSNHARPGAEGRHNLVYWRYGDYVGIGPGAHGRVTVGGRRWAVAGRAAPEAWLDAVERGAGGALRREPVAAAEQAVEMLMMGLRLDEGVDLARRARLAGQGLPERALAEMTALGLVIVEGGRLRATEAGRPVLNAVLKELLVQ